MYLIIISTINTDKHAPQATVSSSLPKNASATATARPNEAEIILSVAYKIAGNVIAVSTAYGV